MASPSPYLYNLARAWFLAPEYSDADTALLSVLEGQQEKEGLGDEWLHGVGAELRAEGLLP